MAVSFGKPEQYQKYSVPMKPRPELWQKDRQKNVNLQKYHLLLQKMPNKIHINV